MSHRVLRFIVIVTVPIALLAGLMVGVARAAGDTTAAISPTSGPAGATVVGSGQNWQPGDHIQAEWGDDNSNLGNSVVVASDGTFKDSFTLPANATLGSHQVLFWDEEGQFFEVANFSITSTTPPPQPSSCPAAELVGLHGVGEGPSSSMSTTSTTIAETFSAFKTDTTSRGVTGVQTSALGYPTISRSDIMSVSGIYDAETTVLNTAVTLNAVLQAFNSQCPRTPVLLAGYSMGAWIINNMLSTMSSDPGAWDNIKAVMLYGDPCWYNNSGKYQGLAREELADTCGIAPTYPYPASSSTLPFKVESLCYGNDPVCGQGFTSSLILPAVDYQITFAGNNCNYTPNNTTYGKCPHFYYEVGGPTKGATAQGASFLAPYA
jgi:hypothetical protein